MPEEIQEPPAQRREKIKIDDIVIISVIAICGLGGVLLTFFRAPAAPILTSIFMATAMSALVYRFLGGIHAGTSFSMGFIQVGGSLAALFGLIYFLNPIMERQMSIDPDNPFPGAQWFAMGPDLIPRESVDVGAYGPLRAPAVQPLTGRLSIEKRDDNDAFSISSKSSDHSFPLGDIESSSLRDFVRVTFPEQRIDTYKSDLLPARSPDPKLRASGFGWPFSLETGMFDEGRSQYFLTNKSTGEKIYEGWLRNRQYEIAYVEGRPYFVAVAAANHQRADSSWVQFIIGELMPDASFE